MKISTRRPDKTTIFDLSGEIDFANSPEVRQLLLSEIRETHTPRVVVNLSGVRYVGFERPGPVFFGPYSICFYGGPLAESSWRPERPAAH